MLGMDSESSSSSSNTNTSWLYEYMSPIIIDFIESNPTIDYKESIIAEMPPAMQEALARYGSGDAIDAGKALAQGGAGLMTDSIAWMQNALSGGTLNAFKSGVSGIMGAASPFMEEQAAAIQDDVYASMAGAFGSGAQSTMSNSAVTNSSSAEMTTNAVMASGANAMTQGIASMQADVLSSAIGLTTDAIGAAAGVNKGLLNIGQDIVGAGAGLIQSGAKNQFNAGLFELYYNQQVLDNNRKNDMINSNLEWIDMAALMAITMPAAGLKTESESETSSSGSSGWF